MSGHSKKLRKKILRLLAGDPAQSHKIKRLLSKYNPALSALLHDIAGLTDANSREQLYTSMAAALLDKKKDAKKTQKLSALLRSNPQQKNDLQQNRLIDLKRPYKKSPCSGCAANRNGLCRCAQKAVRKIAQK